MIVLIVYPNYSIFQNQFHKNVKVVRTDNTKELCEGQMRDIYHKLGIERKHVQAPP